MKVQASVTNKQPPSLLRRLILSQVLAMGIAWLALLGWIIFAMLEFGNGDLDRRMLYFAKSLAEAASGSGTDEARRLQRLKAAEKIFLDGFNELKSVSHYQPVYQIFNATGELIYRTPNAPTQPIAPLDGVFAEREFLDHTWRTVSASSSDSLLRVHIAERNEQRLATNWRMVRNIGLSQLIICLWCVIVIWVAAQRGFRPLKALANQLSSRKLSDVQPVTVVHRYAETAPIVDELNALLERESTRLQTERNFLADAAHELRTPLAAINAQAHALLTATNDVAKQQTSAELTLGVERISHLITQLLSVARAEVMPTAPRQMIDVAVLARERLAIMAASARANQIELSLEAPEQLMCAVDSVGFSSMLENLVDNALRHAHSNHQSEIQVVVSLRTQADGAVQLQVCDNGPGISKALQSMVFDRFYRVPGTQKSGSGLGLAIVKRIAESHAATITLSEGLGGRGLGVCVLLPKAKSF